MPSFADLARPSAAPLGGLVAGAGPYALLHLVPLPRWVVVPTRDEADRWVRALRFFRPQADVRLYPADDGRPWDGTSPDPELPRLRVAARVATGATVVVPAKALLARVPADLPPWTLRRGARLDREAFLRWLGARGYLVTQKVEDPATVSVRGGVIDIWPVPLPHPVRLDLFDDEIDHLRALDPETGRSGAGMETVTVLPAREAVLDAEAAERAAAALHAVATERGEWGPYRRVLQDLRNGVWFPGAEDYLPALGRTTLLRLDAPTVVVEPERVAEELAAFEEQVRARFDALPADDRPLVRPFDRWARAAEVRLGHARPLRALAVDGALDLGTRDNRVLRVGASLDPTVAQLREWAREGRAVTVVAEGERRAERIRALFAGHDLALAEGRAGPRRITLEVGDLPEGFQSKEVVFVTADELFGDRLHDTRSTAHAASGTRAFRRAARARFSSVQRGALVVHVRHGIGRYQGLARLPLGVGEGDFVVVEYRDGQKLYVPIHRLDLLAPYQAGPGESPRLDRLGGATWEARKAKVRDAVLALAAELLQLHARRQLATAPAFEGRDEDYLRFEEAFPYVETADQETAIADVLGDLAQGRPMDRLLVGDVGFGKTEVAMRAAFRVAQDGWQVAVLCPTSVLALQHTETFRRRFAGTALRVEGLSRLSPAAQAKAVRDGLADGTVDVVVGTTALLGGKVRFRRLGLVVVDEEHRFGTRQKEQLKRLATGVHQLAMSATPIPRTLQMALSGMRGLSVLSTPPVGRQRIRTEVVRFSAERVREDILYELRRGGQVYVVHNRVQSLGGVLRWLERLVPEATFVAAHGQMEDRALEAALARFIRGEAQVLVSTAIIESGIDLPLVNTMIINRGETFGTAQLYQLRGRIGRGTVRGHCTVLVAGEGSLRREAMVRLRALQEHTELGSNFALAAEDLELRGSGEILGDKQHGHIAAIGFDAYLELLEEAIGRARGEAAREQVDPEVEVPLACNLPDAWIPDLSERLDAYQRIAHCRTRAEVRREMADLEGRHGEAPPEALNLGWLTEARLRCRELGIERFAVFKVRAAVRLHPHARVPAARVDELCRGAPNRFKRVGPHEIDVRFTPEEAQVPFRLIDWVCNQLAENRDDRRPRG